MKYKCMPNVLCYEAHSSSIYGPSFPLLFLLLFLLLCVFLLLLLLLLLLLPLYLPFSFVCDSFLQFYCLLFSPRDSFLLPLVSRSSLVYSIMFTALFTSISTLPCLLSLVFLG